MPELPEVETVRRILSKEITGKQITGVTFRDFPGVVGDMDPEVFRAMVVGRTLEAPLRRGKYLSIPLDDDLTLVIHLRMTGRMLVLPANTEPVRFEHLALHLDGDIDLRYADQRKFGRVLCLEHEAAVAALAKLGPEPLERAFTSRYLISKSSRRTAPIKNFLLDQRVVAGLGNIYVDEALFQARIHPLTPAGELSTEEAARLVRAIRRILRSATERQGTTFSSFENPYGEGGANADFLRVYGRANRGLPCTRCGTSLEWFKLGGRGTSVCPNCQQLPISGTG